MPKEKNGNKSWARHEYGIEVREWTEERKEEI
jgi:hypothetical protein